MRRDVTVVMSVLCSLVFSWLFHKSCDVYIVLRLCALVRLVAVSLAGNGGKCGTPITLELF